ncbi:MAG: HAMP domain-containing histidine kinase [Blautia sp.]|nr:HAMP domain-containing histidine kinase [Blautia sp.]
MKGRILRIGAGFAAVLLLLAFACVWLGGQKQPEESLADQIVAVNEIEQLARAGEAEEAAQKAAVLKMELEGGTGNGAVSVWLFCGVSLVFLAAVLGYVYAAVLRPFDKLKTFAEEIAGGNLDLALDYERANYFGAFTWAFDSMRREITRARACEREAIENNKTIIATLSHDIKTPIASIRAYAEGLEANLDSTPEKRQRYVSVLMRKCDEVSRLTNDLFLHSLADLDKLQLNLEEFELVAWAKSAVGELAGDKECVRFCEQELSARVFADPNRLLQVLENLISNAGKYAKSRIDVGIRHGGADVELYVRDYGAGIPDEDMPFIFDRFYRGKNSGGEQGSGLGLYIVRYIMEKMGGTVTLCNRPDGLEAVVSLPVLEDTF